MAVIRRNIITDAQSADKFVQGVLALKAEVQPGSTRSTYDAMVVWHWRAMMKMTPKSQNSRNAAHKGPAFLPWHRFMLIVFERQLQRILGDQTFGLPYWSWAADGEKPASQQASQPIWSNSILGNSAFNSVQTFPVRVETNAAGTRLVTTLRKLARDLGANAPDLPKKQHVSDAVAHNVYDESNWDITSSTVFRNVLEGWQPHPPALHNRVHVWVGGDMLPGTSPNDPVFYLNHCNVDRIWAAWQKKNGLSTYSPPQSAPAYMAGHRPNDKLFSVFPTPPRVKDMFDVSSVYKYDTLGDI